MASLIIACNLPAGLIVEHGGFTIRLNGAHVGIDDPENLPRNGMMADTTDRISGYGLTTLDGLQADAFLEWWEGVTQAPDGKPLQHPYAPIATGSLERFETKADARKELAKRDGMALGGLNPEKDLPEGVETVPPEDKKG